MFLFEMAAIPFPCNVFWLLWSIYLISLIYSIELFISQIVRFHTMEYRDRIKRLKMRRSLVYLGVAIEAPQQMMPGSPCLLWCRSCNVLRGRGKNIGISWNYVITCFTFFTKHSIFLFCLSFRFYQSSFQSIYL